MIDVVFTGHHRISLICVALYPGYVREVALGSPFDQWNIQHNDIVWAIKTFIVSISDIVDIGVIKVVEKLYLSTYFDK